MRIVNLDNIEYMYWEVETTEYKVLEYDVSTSTFETFEDTYQLQETGPLVFSYIIDNRLLYQRTMKLLFRIFFLVRTTIAE